MLGVCPKAPLKCCHALHCYVRTIFTMISSLRNSLHLPQMEIKPPRTACGCPRGWIICIYVILYTQSHRVSWEGVGRGSLYSTGMNVLLPPLHLPPIAVPNKPYGFCGREAPCLLTVYPWRMEMLAMAQLRD